MKTPIPVLVNHPDFIQVIFSLPLDNVPAEDATDRADNIAEFLKKSLDVYSQRYARVKGVYRVLAAMDVDEIAAELCGVVASTEADEKVNGGCQIVFSFILHKRGYQLDQEKPNAVLVKDVIRIEVHWPNIKDASDLVTTVTFPGFMLEHDIVVEQDLSKNSIRDRVIFDMRVIDSDVENSSEFMIHDAARNLGPWFTYSELLYGELISEIGIANEKQVGVDRDAIIDHLNTYIAEYRERRMSDPASTERLAFKLDMVYSFDQEMGWSLEAQILADTYETSTPELHPIHSGYEHTEVSKDEKLRSFPVSIK